MARYLKFKIGKTEFEASPSKVDRRKLYGWTELGATDDAGENCRLLTTDQTGKYIIPLGGTGIGILSEQGEWVERSELKTTDMDGNPAPMFPSSFSVVNRLSEKVPPSVFLEYNITDFYQLDDAPAQMVNKIGSDIYTFSYTYNDSYSPSTAFVMAAGYTLFLLVGERNIYEWLCFDDCEAIDEDHDDRLIQEGDEDIDFSMF